MITWLLQYPLVKACITKKGDKCGKKNDKNITYLSCHVLEKVFASKKMHTFLHQYKNY